MRLWHKDLIGSLPRQQLLGQHRECCALRGKGWARPHHTVNYVFKYPVERLYKYHIIVMDEMELRGYQVNQIWRQYYWRGNALEWDMSLPMLTNNWEEPYPEHDDDYYAECVANLHEKGVYI